MAAKEVDTISSKALTGESSDDSWPNKRPKTGLTRTAVL